MESEDVIKAKNLAYNIRRNAIDMISSAHASHIGSVFSCADIIAVLYSNILRINNHNLKDENRDRFVLSKGHAGVALYVALAECGYYPISELLKYGKNGSFLSCHVSHKVPGVEVSTGSLGHGVSMACGMALNAKVRNKDYKVYAIIGDGECNEGIVWETAMLSAQKKLDNFTVIIDRNRMQALGFCKDIINMDNMTERWSAFGWDVHEVDGHSYIDLIEAFRCKVSGKPKVIIANTIKGYGVSFMENELLWHYRDPQGEYYNNAIKELEKYLYAKPCN